MGCDAYHLGSMISSLITTVGMTPLLMMGLEPSLRWQEWKGSFEEALVFLRPAFADAVEYVSAEVSPYLRDDVTSVLRQLWRSRSREKGPPLDARDGGIRFLWNDMSLDLIC